MRRIGAMLVATLLVGVPSALSGQSQERLNEAIASYRFGYGLCLNSQSPYRVATSDLNGDQRPEVLVLVSGDPFTSDEGYSLYILTPDGAGYRTVGSLPTDLPVRLLPSRHGGWRDIGIRRRVPTRPSVDFAIPFDGEAYRAVREVRQHHGTSAETILMEETQVHRVSGDGCPIRDGW